MEDTKDAILFNGLVSAWGDVTEQARKYASTPRAAQQEIDFNQDEPPEYTDFAYFSVGLGMTYQVADTNVTRNEVRRIVIAQTLLGYLFGAGIIATVINLITGLG